MKYILFISMLWICNVCVAQTITSKIDTATTISGLQSGTYVYQLRVRDFPLYEHESALPLALVIVYGFFAILYIIVGLYWAYELIKNKIQAK